MVERREWPDFRTEAACVDKIQAPWLQVGMSRQARTVTAALAICAGGRTVTELASAGAFLPPTAALPLVGTLITHVAISA